MLERLPEFIGNNPFLSLTFIGLLLALIFTELAKRSRGYKELRPNELTRLINDDNIGIIDVSAINEFESGHIVGSKHVTASQADPQTKPLSRYQERPVAIVCRNGQTSAGVCSKLVKAGFKQVHWLKGGIAEWTGENLPLVRK